MRTVVLVILIGLFSNLCIAQNKTSINDVRNIYDEKGDFYFDKKEYKKAIVYYNMAYSKDANNYYSVLKKAKAFSALELYDQAAECYRVIFDTDLHIPNEFRLEFSFLLLQNKDIKGFNEAMATYNEIVRSEISGYISSNAARAKMYKDTSIVIVENESVLNTPESEISPAIYNNQIVFASTRKNLAGNSGNSYYNLYTASYLSGGQLGRLNNFNNSLNTSKTESSTAFLGKSNKLYVTRGSSQKANLKTFETTIPSGKTDRLDVHELSIEGVSNIGHVTFNSKGTKMYFVSDAAGGSGGLDIYYSEIIGDKWSKAVNLGTSINSSKDEMYPHVVNDTVLYFTSAGHNGLGGLDLYSVSLTQENSKPKNLGSKVNSPYDDYSLTFTPEGLTGYFSSNRPGGFGKEDIYRLHLLDIKVKYAAYKFKQQTSMEDGKINLYLSNGDEYNIASQANAGFNFQFEPAEGYKMVIQHENALASNIIYNTKLSPEQKRKEFLTPKPLHKTEIPLTVGMSYQFTAGMKPLSNEYKSSLNQMSEAYQNSNSTIDLTALAKELLLKEGEVYTIRFVKDESQYSDDKSKDESTLYINEHIVNTEGKAFFFVLPLDIEANFNIKTDIDHFKDNFNPKKVGSVSVDDAPVIKEEKVELPEGFPILVNTEIMKEVSPKKIKATELTIIPGSLYILTLKKTDPESGEELEIVVPLTKGVKYNLGTEAQSQAAYTKAVSQIGAAKASSNTDEELIDISILSNELDVAPGEEILFSLVPAAKIGSQGAAGRNVLTTLDVDGRKYFITDRHKLQVNLKLPHNQSVNIQTDLAYVKENFDPSTIALKLDTTSFNTKFTEVKKEIITDPVFDVVVVNFDLNEYVIRADAKTILASKVIEVLQSDRRLYVTIKGYTDGLGNAEHNAKLSSDRAHAVKNFLTNNGIGESRIRTFSFGESLALKDGVKWEDLSESELQKHRKVEIVIYLPE